MNRKFRKLMIDRAQNASSYSGGTHLNVAENVVLISEVSWPQSCKRCSWPGEGQGKRHTPEQIVGVLGSSSCRSDVEMRKGTLNDAWPHRLSVSPCRSRERALSQEQKAFAQNDRRLFFPRGDGAVSSRDEVLIQGRDGVSLEVTKDALSGAVLFGLSKVQGQASDGVFFGVQEVFSQQRSTKPTVDVPAPRW